MEQREIKMQRQLKFRLRIDEKVVGYEKWYAGKRAHISDPVGADPQWLYSEDDKYWNPARIFHNKKDEWTGLKDKNGKEIYEGDIISKPRMGAKAQAKWGNYKHIVQWGDIDGEGGIYGVGFPVFSDGYEVIGNIYENPELLP